MKLCDYGCGKEATYQFKNGNWCCSNNHRFCSNITKKRINSKKENRLNGKLKREKPELCDYNCGKPAIYYFKTVDKWCCCEKQMKCKKQRKKYSNTSKGRVPYNKNKKGIYSKETLDKMSAATTRNNTGKHLSEETRIKISIGNSKPKQSEKFKEEQRQRMLNGQALKMIKCIKKISNEEIKLRNMVKEIYSEAEFQFGVFNYSLDVALVDKKIAIEYDGYYHFDSEEKKKYHKQRQEKIEKEGWKFLRYTMFDKFPSLEQIKKDITETIN